MILTYKGRQRLKSTLSVALALAILASIILLVWVLWLHRYVEYTRDGAYLDFSRSSRDIEGEAV